MVELQVTNWAGCYQALLLLFFWNDKALADHLLDSTRMMLLSACSGDGMGWNGMECNGTGPEKERSRF